MAGKRGRGQIRAVQKGGCWCIIMDGLLIERLCMSGLVDVSVCVCVCE